MTLSRLVARPMLASMFVVGGIDSLRNAEKKVERAKPVTDKIADVAKKVAPSAPVPTDAATLIRVNGAIHVAAGLALATGKAPRLASLVLAATMVPTTAGGHRFWEESDPAMRANQRVHFFKNVSMLGGLLLAAVDTAGKPGLAWRAKHAAGDVRKSASKTAKGITP
ncbi:MAG TPA: DoxX family protein [Nocardioidaceae bacterium]|nr:DoxX family protein [Nocardioidaceae bacterium]